MAEEGHGADGVDYGAEELGEAQDAFEIEMMEELRAHRAAKISRPEKTAPAVIGVPGDWWQRADKRALSSGEVDKSGKRQKKKADDDDRKKLEAMEEEQDDNDDVKKNLWMDTEEEGKKKKKKGTKVRKTKKNKKRKSEYKIKETQKVF